MFRWIKIVVVLYGLQLCAGAQADGEKPKVTALGVDRVCADCVEVGSWSFSLAFGLGGRTNPLVDGDDTPLVVLPELSYYGKRFFLKNMELGYTFWETPQHQLNVIVAPSFDQMHFNRWDIHNVTDTIGLSSTLSPPQGGGSTDQLTGGGSVDGGSEDTDSASGSDNAGGNTGGDAASGGVGAGVANGANGGDLGGPTAIGGETDNSTAGEGDSGNKAPSSPSSGNGSSVDDAESVVDAAPPAAAEDSGAQEQDGAGAELGYDLKKRRLALMGGLEYSYTHSVFALHLQGLSDITQIHSGHEFRAAVVFPFEYDKNRWALTLGANYQSRGMLDYYYGVDASESASHQWLYRPKSAGISQLVRLDWQRWVSPKWSWRATLQYSYLSKAIRNSPIAEDDSVTTFFVGGVYHF